MKKPIFKIPFSRNSKTSVWKTKFFPRQAKPKILFALLFHCTGDTAYRVWFHLDNSLTRWKRPIFKIPFSWNSKSFVWKPKFFPRQAFPSFFLLYNVITNTDDTPYRVWFDLDNSLTQWKNLFLKFLFREIQKLPYEKPNFFLGKLNQKYFLFYFFIAYRVWLDLDNALTRWKNLF